MRVLLTTFGSYGDLYPYIAIGRELRQLGHDVSLGTSPAYREKIERHGLGFLPVRPDVALEDTEMMRDFFDQYRGTERVVKSICSVLRESYEDTLAAAREFDAIVTHPITFAAVLVAQKLKMRWISSVLAPGSFLSSCDPPLPAPMPWLVKVRLLGPGAMRAVWNATRLMIARWLRPVADLRREIGLPPGGNPLFEGANSPDLVLALFSPVFAKPQCDWPEHTVATGFPFLDANGGGLAPELESFFHSGPPPVVFTLGSSAVAAAGDFYTSSLEAAQRAGARALFLTGPHPQGLPETLPDGAFAWPYAPHEQVFPRASVIVHQGGIGTTAQALRSGIPSLIVPFAHDQFDNAERTRRLGAAVTIPRRNYTGRRAENALRLLLSQPRYRESAAAVGELIRAEEGAAAAARAIERYLRSG